MNNQESYSEEILDLISKHPFDQLSYEEQEHVLSEMDRETYEELHDSYLLMYRAEQSAEIIPKVPPISPAMHTALKKKESRTSHNNKVLWYTRPIPVWQAAAVFLLLLGASIILWQSGKSAPQQLMTLIDTVYVDQPKQILYDTVYLERNKEESSIQQAEPESAKPETTKKRDVPSEINGLQILTLDQMDKVNRKGNPRKEQELLNKFGVVSM